VIYEGTQRTVIATVVVGVEIVVVSIYRSVKGYLRWIRYVAPQKKFSYPLRRCSSWGADSNKVYSYRKVSPSTERIFTLDRESTACRSPFLVVQNSFLLKRPVWGGFIAACKQAALNKIRSSFDESGLLFFESFPLRDVCTF